MDAFRQQIPPTHCSVSMLQAHLRMPGLAAAWLQDAASVPLVRGDPELQAMIARHPNTPLEARLGLIRGLPLPRILALLEDHPVGPDLRFTCMAHLSSLWLNLGPRGRHAFAEIATEPVWGLIWKTADEATLEVFLANPMLSARGLTRLIQPPLTRAQAEAVRKSRFRASQEVIFQVLITMALSFREPGTDLVLGLAAPWIKALTPQERMMLAPALSYPPLERLTEVWSNRLSPSA